MPRNRSALVTALAMMIVIAAPALAAPVPVDLNTWTPADQPHSGSPTPALGNWVVDLAGTSVVQTVNGGPTFFVSPQDAIDQRITASFTTPAADNDTFGIALGFSTDPGDPLTDYLLIDWRQSDQAIDWGSGTGPVTGTAGLAVSRVTGVPTLNELWGHTNSPANPAGGVSELQRGANLGSVGWSDSTTYGFVIEYTATSLDVWVEGTLEISIAGTFPAGPMALYNFSQADMTMSGITTEPLNTPPAVVGGGAPDVTVSEGGLGVTSGAFTDSDDDPLTLGCTGNCAGFVDNLDGSWSWSQILAEGPSSFSVTVSASDGVGGVASDVFDVTVLNLAPVITGTSGVSGTHDMGNALEVSADFTDAGVLDTHTALFSWGDGSSSAGTVQETSGSGTATGSHLYTDPGFYTVSVTVTDDDGASDTAVIGEVFVFDPDTFVTGGGWIAPPAGAWAAHPDHEGKTTFGFVARYDRSGTVRGSLEVQVHKGLNLKATSFDYLLINHGVAIFEGDATVNGSTGFTFKVVATDERLASSAQDLFDVTIWDGSAVVYDTGTGLTIVGKGIQVHQR